MGWHLKISAAIDLRKVKKRETTNDLFALPVTEANVEVGAFHPMAMPVILTRPDEIDQWRKAPVNEALWLQRPWADYTLQIVARRDKKDG